MVAESEFVTVVLPAWFVSPLLAGMIAGLVAWATVRIELRYLKRAIEAAHDRLDAIKAPSGRVRL